jgi:hypothetical protein
MRLQGLPQQALKLGVKLGNLVLGRRLRAVAGLVEIGLHEYFLRMEVG